MIKAEGSRRGRSRRPVVASAWTRTARVMLLGVALGLAGAGTAWAEPSAADKETARALLNGGDAAYKSGKHEEALKHYNAAHAIMNVPTTGIEVAKAQEALGKLVEARDTLLAVTRYPKKANEPKAFTNARERALARASAIAARIPSATIRVTGLAEGVSPTVTIDGVSVNPAVLGVPRKLNPGKHAIAVSAPGYAEVRKEIDVAERAEVEVPIELVKSGDVPAVAPGAVSAPASSSDGSKTEAPSAATVPPGGDAGTSQSTSSLAYVGFGVGAVGFVAGGITGALAFSKAGAAQDQCTDNICPPNAQSDIDSSKSMGTISTISFAVGVVGAAVGIYGLMSPSEPESPAASRIRVQPAVGLGNVGLMGQF